MLRRLMGQHFACTACGRCCRGWVPLTVGDALIHMGRFPLAMVWSPVRQGSKAFAWTEKIGLTLRPKGGKPLAVRIAPTVFIPAAMECPALTAEGLCGIQECKPLRCHSMPFFPYREEGDQRDLLLPRPGWLCDVGPEAPVVYDHKTIQQPDDFQRERQALLHQSEQIRSYARWAMQVNPQLPGQLQACAAKPSGGHVALGIAGFLRQLPPLERSHLAQQQYGVLQDALSRSVAGAPNEPDYPRFYADWGWELERLLPDSGDHRA